MSRDPRYDILFEPMDIGPVTAKNRFFQVPHCNGGGYRDPSAAAQMRNSKAEGGWGVIFTEQVEMHHTSEITPFIELRLWDDKDIPMLAKMADQIHEYDALAGLELTYSGINGPNLYTKEVPRGPSAGPILTFTSDPVSARAMDKQDIKDLRRWYRNAFIRSKEAGYDLVCLYGAHGFGIIQHFLSRATNHRTDEYGGSLENRSRLMRELIEEGKDAVGDTVGISVRLSLNEILGEHGFSNAELRDCIEMNAEVPDLWDLAHGSWEDCSETSRFGEEGAQQPLVQGIKALTPKPVVGVGRFTSPDLMVKQVKSGVLDFIGAARPSIADPFIPKKIDEDRIEDIRECIGCNICVTGDTTMSISRCTQNPTFIAKLPPYVMLSHDHPLADRKTINIEELVDHPMVMLDLPLSRDYFLSLFHQTGLRPLIGETATDMGVMRSMVANGFGYGLANLRPQNEMSPEGLTLKHVPLEGDYRPVVIGIATMRTDYTSAVMNAFMEHCHTSFRNNNFFGSQIATD